MKYVWYYKKGENNTMGFKTNDSLSQISKDLRANGYTLVAVYFYETDEVKVYSNNKNYRTMASYEWKANIA